MNAARALLLAFALLVITAAPAAAQAWRLDPSFGTGGLVRTDVPGDRPLLPALAPTPDGGVFAAGGGGLVRYDPGGQPLAGFGTGGVAQTDLDGRAVAVAPGGEVFVAGSAAGEGDNDFAVARFSPEGTALGALEIPAELLAGSGRADALLVDTRGAGAEDDVLYVGGTASLPDTGRQPVLLAFDSAGAPVAGFTQAATEALTAGGLTSVTALAAGPDGAVLAAGDGPEGPAVLRLTSAGAADQGFAPQNAGTLGVADTALVVDFDTGPEGEIVIALDDPFADENVVLVRLDAAGAPDTEFGTGGPVPTAVPFPAAVAFQADGAVVVAGAIGNELVLTRYGANGSLDESFGPGGQLAAAVEADTEVDDLLVTAGGEIVVGASEPGAGEGQPLQLLLARFELAPPPDPTPQPPPPDPTPQPPPPDPGPQPPAPPVGPAVVPEPAPPVTPRAPETPAPVPALVRAISGGSVSGPFSPRSLSRRAGGGGTRRAVLPGLQARAPYGLRARRGSRRSLPITLTAERAGRVTLKLVRRGRVRARGGALFTRAGSAGFSLRLSGRVGRGTHILKVSFRPTGGRARTRSLPVRIR